MAVLDGTNLILSVAGKALAFSDNCKVNTTVETGQRITKETSQGKWPEKYVKSFSEDISADGCVLADNAEGLPAYDELKAMQLNEEPVEVSYSTREGNSREGKKDSGYKGSYLITSLELSGPAGDDAKYSVKLESTGPVERIGGGLTGEVAAPSEN